MGPRTGRKVARASLKDIKDVSENWRPYLRARRLITYYLCFKHPHHRVLIIFRERERGRGSARETPSWCLLRTRATAGPTCSLVLRRTTPGAPARALRCIFKYSHCMTVTGPRGGYWPTQGRGELFQNRAKGGAISHYRKDPPPPLGSLVRRHGEDVSHCQRSVKRKGDVYTKLCRLKVVT